MNNEKRDISKLHIGILMSAYNGQDYVEKQLDSLMGQKNINFTLYIRDDGSKDSTAHIIEKYIAGKENVVFEKGENIGVKPSFMKLMRDAKECDYYAFCDQDDIWDDDKIYSLVEKLENYDINVPNCAFSNYRLIDEHDNVTLEAALKDKIEFNLSNVIPENPSPGCTMVFNKKVWEMIVAKEEPKHLYIHDRWVITICAALGNVAYLGEPKVSYRQHSNNTIGYNNSLKKKLNYWKGVICGDKKTYCAEMKELYDYYGDLMDEKSRKIFRKIYEYDKSFIKRMKLIFDFKIHGYSLGRDIDYRLRVLLGKK